MQTTLDWSTEQARQIKKCMLALIIYYFLWQGFSSLPTPKRDQVYPRGSSQAIKRTSREDENTTQDESHVHKFKWAMNSETSMSKNNNISSNRKFCYFPGRVNNFVKYYPNAHTGIFSTCTKQIPRQRSHRTGIMKLE